MKALWDKLLLQGKQFMKKFFGVWNDHCALTWLVAIPTCWLPMSENEGPDIMPQMRREPLLFRPLSHRRWYQFIEIICLNLVVVDVYFFILKWWSWNMVFKIMTRILLLSKISNLKPLSPKSRRNYSVLTKDHISNV